PLARLQVALGILEQKAGAAHGQQIESARQKAEQIAALVNDLLSFSKTSLAPDKVTLRTVELSEAVRSAIQREVDTEGALRVDVPAGLKVHADPELLGRALSNLVRNAIRYAGAVGPVSVRGWREGESVCVMVADQGPGIPEEHLSRIFDPFYRIDPSRDRST